jgi:hypothetical protein
VSSSLTTGTTSKEFNKINMFVIFDAALWRYA